MKMETTKKEKILFLDIDSCLNHFKYGEDYMDFRKEEVVEDGIPLHMSNVAALKKIIDNVDNLSIVWSTDWRLVNDTDYNGWKNPRLWLEQQQWFISHLIGHTPKKMSSTRFEEIHFWFNDNKYNKKFRKQFYHDVGNYAIIDDYDSLAMDRYGNHFFKCNFDKGLTDDMADKIIEFLKNDDFDENEMDWRRND